MKFSPIKAFLFLCVSASRRSLFVSLAHAQGLPVACPQTVGMDPAKLNQIDALVEQDIKDKKLPGAVVLVGHKGKIVFRKAYGNRSLVPTVEPMTVDTIFDLASLTKVVATTTSIMILVEQGKTAPLGHDRQIHSRDTGRTGQTRHDPTVDDAHVGLCSRL